MSTRRFDLPTGGWCARPSLHVETGLAAHLLVVLAWQVDCVHGRAAMVELARVAHHLTDMPVACLSVHVAGASGRSEPAAAAFLRSLPIPIATAFCPDDAWLRQQQGNALPYVYVVDALADVRFAGAGVPRSADLLAAVKELLREPAARGRVPDVPFVPHRLPAAVAASPAAILLDDEITWLALPERHQVIAVDQQHNVVRVVGSGAWGSEDGSQQRASFALPVGLVAHDASIVVLDAGNHMVRSIDRETGDVETICGNGRLGNDAMGGSYGRDQALHSPHAAISREGGLYLSHAGTDQLWQVDPMTGAAMSWLDGFDEPRGLAMQADVLWVADAGSGELAQVDLAHVHRTTALGGLQRPVDVAMCGSLVLLADVDACRVLAFDPATGRAETWFDASHGLRGPLALAVSEQELHVLDASGWFTGLFADGERPVELTPRRLSLSFVAHGRGAQVTSPIDVREHSDVTLRVPSEAADTCVVDVVDEAQPTLAVARHGVAVPCDGYAEVLVPVAAAGSGAWRVRVTGGEHVACFVVPVAVTPEGALAVTLAVAASE